MSAVLNLNELQMWVALIALFLSTGTAIWNLVTSGHKKVAKDVGDMRERLGQFETKIDHLEQRVDALPDREAVHRLELGMASISGDMKAMRAGMEPIKQMAENMTAMLMDSVRGPKNGN